jgi:predicted house-cleaning noncanonical NTP pyrophosphatase (MazG superfamily)
MRPQQFIEAIKDVVRDAAIDDVISNLKDPPGRTVDKHEAERSAWYNQLSLEESAKVNSAIESAVNEALFGMLTVIDGVRAAGFDGKLILSHKDSGGETILNDPEKIALHDLYSS